MNTNALAAVTCTLLTLAGFASFFVAGWLSGVIDWKNGETPKCFNAPVARLKTDCGKLLFAGFVLIVSAILIRP